MCRSVVKPLALFKHNGAREEESFENTVVKRIWFVGGRSDVVSPDALLLVHHRPTGSVTVDAVPWAVRVVRGAAHSRMMMVVVVVRP